MAKRFTATEIWGEDWFLDMSIEYKLLWFFILSKCDHAGCWKPNKKIFEATVGKKVNLGKALANFNYEKERIRITSKNNWWIVDFFVFQYGATFNINNKLHSSIQLIYNQEGIPITESRGLKEVVWGTWIGQPKDYIALKEKDKEIYINEYKVKNIGNGKSKKELVNFKAQPEELLAERFRRNEEAALANGKQNNRIAING